MIMKSHFTILAFACFFVLGSCSSLEESGPLDENDLIEGNEGNPINARISNQGVEPILWTSGPGGNATCVDVGLEFEETTSRNNYENGEFDHGWPEGLDIEVVDGIFVNWSFDLPADQCLESIAFIVKGGPASNIYIYEGGQNADEGLVAPLVGKKKKKYAGLSNLTVCYSIVKCEEIGT